MYIVNFRMDMFFSGYLDIMSLKKIAVTVKQKLSELSKSFATGHRSQQKTIGNL